MRLTVRTDAGTRIGGGHVMRCLTLARAARARGHTVAFVMVEQPGDLVAMVRDDGFAVHGLTASPDPVEVAAGDPPHASWLALPWAADAAATHDILAADPPDWLIVDHYGLDARWVAAATQGMPDLRVMAIDDLDDRPLGAELLLSQTEIGGAPHRHPAPLELTGPRHALLRDDFARLRPAALARRGGRVERVLVTPGMGDAVGLAPAALTALGAFPGLSVDVAMGSQSPSAPAVATMIAERPGWRLHLDSPDMGSLMVAADLCIGAGGMTSWERCCLGLPAIVVSVADNQRGVAEGLAAIGACVHLTLDEARDAGRLAREIAALIGDDGARAMMSARAATACDGTGTALVVAALEAGLRPLRPDDARLLFDWRNRPDIRAVSLDPAPLVWERHLAWLASLPERRDGLWLVYHEGGRDLGHVNAVATGDGAWRWGFYIGAEGAPKGAGGRMLSTFLARLFRRGDVDKVVAEVLAGNAASLALHRKLWFKPIAEEASLVRLELARRVWEDRFSMAATT